MPSPEAKPTPPPTGGDWFRTTHWSVVLNAADTSGLAGQQALEKLCAMYWYSLYAFVRRRGSSAEDAQDLTQAFFAWFLERKSVKLASRERGKFRSFLLTSLKHFLVNEWQRGRARKRGGDVIQIPLDQLTVETRYRHEPSHDLTPDRIYERSWAMAVLEQVRGRLQEEYTIAGKGDRFAQLEQFLPGQAAELTYAEA